VNKIWFFLNNLEIHEKKEEYRVILRGYPTISKELKSRYDLDVVNTKNTQIIEAYIWISILTLLISRRIYNIVRKYSPKEKIVRYTQLRWSTIFTENASDQLTLILRYYGIERTFETVMNVYQSQALDPHVNRERFRAEWWS
jgi:putative transposase